jgi:4-hydroxy-tetrahydrodipicolinate synthase
MKLEGAMTAIVTPMRDGAVDYPALERLVHWQIEAGIDAIVAVGTTGESATLSVKEHCDVISKTVEFVNGRVPVIAGAGGNATAEAIELSKASRDAGAEALLHVTPYYNKPTQDGLVKHFEAIAEATPLPVILYNVPGRTACDMLPETVAKLADNANIVAIKEATGDMQRASDILELCGDKITLLSGDDFTTFPLMALGGRGVISVVSNVMPDRMAKMWDAASAGNWDEAKELHYSMMPLCRALFLEANPIPVKAALHMIGKIGPELRSPLFSASPATIEELRRVLHAERML